MPMTRHGGLAATLALLLPALASAQVPFPQNFNNAPTGIARQDVFPYPNQCTTTPGFGGLPACTLSNAKSFACEPSGSGFPNQTAGGWGACGAVTQPKVLRAMDPAAQAKFQFELLNPMDYTPDQAKFTGADYYEIAVHEAWGFQDIATAGTALKISGLFPDPTVTYGAANAVPNGKQWTGLVCTAGAIASGAACTLGQPLFTPIWGVGQKNMGGGPVTTALKANGLLPTPAKRPEWSADNYAATWPSISIRGTTGRPVVVKWTNEFPNNHLFCPHPEAADWPCAIDRTFMGVKASIDPATAPLTFQLAGLPYNGVNQFGGAQQPDNSWVTHLHGGEIPPQTDGFAEKWYGNYRTGRYYSPLPWLLNPAFGAPKGALANQQVGLQYGAIFRPGGDPALVAFNGESSWMYDTYTYPMVNSESTIWFHDHTLGKTHHNVVAGPAGFFPVKDPSKHKPVANGKCSSVNPVDCEYTWLDPVTEPRGALNVPLYDLFMAIQDRAFNDDGSLNFPSGMAQAPVPPAAPGAANYPACLVAAPPNNCSAPGTTAVTPGPNPQVHPVWVPEYFSDHALVNGVLWPKKTVAQGWYRMRFVDGSDSRCYNLSLGTAQGQGGSGIAPTDLVNGRPAEFDVPFTVIATEQGYLRAPLPNQHHLTMCPGERFEILVDFTGFAAGTSIFLNNDAAAPFPDGGAEPWALNTPFAELATIMRFDVGATKGVQSCSGGVGLTWPATTTGSVCMAVAGVTDMDFVDVTKLPTCASQNPADTIGKACIAAERQLYLNEKVDPVTGSSLGLQINGVPFEYDVTETPRKGTYEKWHIVNTTVDAHPIHPHLVKAQIVQREAFDFAGYLTALCGDPACFPGPAPGNIQVLIPDVKPFLVSTRGLGAPIPPDPSEAGWKDAIRALPAMVTTFVAKWDGGWSPQVTAPNAPGSGNSKNPGYSLYAVGAASPKSAASWTYADVTSGPYVWHCHINSHEDSEMMRSSLVVK